MKGCVTLSSSGSTFAKYVSKAGGIVSTAAGCLVLVGWLLDIQPLKTVLPGLPSMVPNTALGLAFAGISLVLQTAQRSSRRTPLRVGQSLAAIVVLLGVVTISEYVFKTDLR